MKSRASRVYSYVVRSDSGFAPNPFFGACTLACCKPLIRKTAQVGDLIVGLSAKSERIVYMMRVALKLDFASYWSSPRFRRKRPTWNASARLARSGDNIYEPLAAGRFRQLPSRHWDHENEREHEGMKSHDTRVDAVLAAKEFVYFGGAGPTLPEYLGFLRIGRAHRCHFRLEQVAEVEHYFAGQRKGVLGRPTLWSSDDKSWRTSCD